MKRLFFILSLILVTSITGMENDDNKICPPPPMKIVKSKLEKNPVKLRSLVECCLATVHTHLKFTKRQRNKASHTIYKSQVAQLPADLLALLYKEAFSETPEKELVTFDRGTKKQLTAKRKHLIEDCSKSAAKVLKF
jgi:hypothetical protein